MVSPIVRVCGAVRDGLFFLIYVYHNHSVRFLRFSFCLHELGNTSSEEGNVATV